ncbi:hypothetical protein GJAV_G00259290 [Gymnothorax javanicus]|nr:hypothetical protein GJAV_G00259290 [Gymnothorax javanicus]
MLCGTQLVMLLCLATLMTVSKSAANEPRAANCDGYSLPSCPRDGYSVCGDDGVVYGNECMLCYKNLNDGTAVRVVRYGRLLVMKM